MPDSPANGALPCTGNRDECHADSWLLGRLITFCVGVAVAVAAWQSDGDIARQTFAASFKQFSSIAPRAAPIAGNTSDMIAMAPQAAPSPDGQQFGAAPLGPAGVPTRPPSRIGYQDVTAPIARQEVVREGFRAHVRTGASTWTGCRHQIRMMRISHISIHPPPKFWSRGWWTATVGRRPQRNDKSNSHRTSTNRFRDREVGRHAGDTRAFDAWTGADVRAARAGFRGRSPERGGTVPTTA
jgi:hypothetical protein